LAAQFRNSDIKTLEDELADHSLQTRFDKHAMKCLSSWKIWYVELHQALRFQTNLTKKPATHRAIVNKKGMTPSDRGHHTGSSLTMNRSLCTEEVEDFHELE
jgi:hypothetical protein